MRYSQLLTEGGNVFKNEYATVSIKKSEIGPTVEFLSNIIGEDLSDEWLGSTGQKASSGDIDLSMDANSATKEELVNKLSAWVKSQHGDPKNYVKKSGVSVHFRSPIGGDPEHGHVQVDFMFLPDVQLSKFTMRADPSSKFKDTHKHIVIASVAKELGLKWSPTIGLISRDSDKLLSKDPDQMATMLFGPGSTRKDITSVESVLRKLAKNPKSAEMLQTARDTLGKEGINI